MAVFIGVSSMIFAPISKSNAAINVNSIVRVQQYINDERVLEHINNISVIENAGNFNDYTDFDDSDFGGSSSSKSSGDLGWILWILHLLPFPLNVILIIVVLIFFFKAGKHVKSNTKQGGTGTSSYQSAGGAGVKYVSPPNIQVPDNTTMISNKIKEKDINFDTTKFLGFAEEAYLNIQDAWTNNDWEKIRTIEHEDLYKKHERQLNEYKKNGTRNVLERISVNQTYLYKYVIDNQYEHVSVLIDATMNDYIININTNQIIRGDYNTRWRGRYILTFTRSKGSLTGVVKDEFETTSCPNCGAPIEITSAGKCMYCDFLITSSKHDWVVSDFDCIKPDYQIDRRGIIVLETKEEVKVNNFPFPNILENKEEDDKN
ncbi:MAG: Tim44-like domain [Clostridiales bacterium]|nr:Tim44-like domain [Clostridiales bacterium]